MAEKIGGRYTLCAIKGASRPARKVRRRRVWHLSPDGFRELRHSCFLSPKACAEFLGVSLRTVRHWDTGRCRVPWSVVRILRLRRLGDLGGMHPGWDGWTVNSRTGELISPNGYVFEPRRLASWTVICEQARLWREDYDRRTAGGVGALAPARPQAVTLAPEVWRAEVLVDALPSPPAVAAAPLTALLAFGKLLQDAGWPGATPVEPQAPPALPASLLAAASSAGPAAVVLAACATHGQALPPPFTDVNLTSECHQKRHFSPVPPGISHSIGPDANRGQNSGSGDV